MKTLKIALVLVFVTSLLFGSVGLVSAEDTDPPEEEKQNPVVEFLANLTGLEASQLEALQAEGYGLGQIAKAQYFITLSGGGDLVSIITQAEEVGWAEVYKSIGYLPKMKKGLGWFFKQDGKPGNAPDDVGPPDHANNDKDKIKDDKEVGPPDHANDDKKDGED